MRRILLKRAHCVYPLIFRVYSLFQCEIGVRDFWDTNEYQMEFYDLCILSVFVNVCSVCSYAIVCTRILPLMPITNLFDSVACELIMKLNL